MIKPLLAATLVTSVSAIALPQPKSQPQPPSAPSTPPRPPQPAPRQDDGVDPKVARDNAHYNLDKDKLALQGYDPVAYFPEGGAKALKGSDKLIHTHRGAVYRFASQANLDAFKKNPNRYEPTYGGWCASAMADGGRKVEINPTNFKVTDGRLFLFYKAFLQDALDYWKKDEKGHTREADEQWRKLAKEEPRLGK